MIDEYQEGYNIFFAFYILGRLDKEKDIMETFPFVGKDKQERLELIKAFEKCIAEVMGVIEAFRNKNIWFSEVYDELCKERQRYEKKQGIKFS